MVKSRPVKEKTITARRGSSKYQTRLIWLVVLALLWQLAAVSRLFNPALLPPLEVIARSLWFSLQNGDLGRAASFSMALIGIGLLLGFLGAIILASLAAVSPAVNGLTDTLTALAHPLPGIALLPLIILWMGTGTRAIVFIIIHSVIWPLILNITTGFRAIPKIHREVGQNLGLSRSAAIRRILIPAALPYLLAGLKIAWARAWRALISAEMIFGAAGGRGGLGWFIFEKRVFMDTPGIYAGIIVIVIIGMVVEDTLFGRIEDLTVKKWGMTI